MELAGSKTPHWLQMMKYIIDPIGFLDKTAKRHGDIFTLSGSLSIAESRAVVVVTHPKAIQQIFTRPKEITSPGELHQAMAPFVGDNSLFVVNDVRHQHRRKLLLPPFHGKRLYTYGQSICEITRKIISRHPPNQGFSIYLALQEISLQVILETVLGLHQPGLRQRLRQRYLAYKGYSKNPLVPFLITFPSLRKDLGRWSPWGQFLYLKQQLDELIYDEIRKCRQQNDSTRTDILSLLVSARDETGESMTDDELCDDLRFLFSAGQEPTAIAIAWAMYWLHTHPNILEKLRQELDGLGEDPDPVVVAKLPYLTAVCNETMRISPIIPFTSPRLVQTPVELMGYQLNPNTILDCCIYLVHQREDLYPEPKKFRPERFLERKFSYYEFLPFGGGERGCIAQPLAEYEIKLVLATLVSHYEWTLVNRRPERYHVAGTFLTPANGIQVKITNLRQPQRQRSPQFVA
ncbi:cytochrome P450 [Leptolyngbyaceae cyanobacterium CCMR0082]|uniref:Cytochrome P450 n=1 Tax=Adonisia turfae CCMR0082 TaxID=2304604 RepID=A0A6M0S027_9CYAN|nr:cytochrome P450 [Adonisia turfae]MDV3347348.1 cytochrome P450 [Leptothoe sp. LEGE 181152]NEZ61804.1 cytochrome P450 [Adonisia turfae CCMR0082]